MRARDLKHDEIESILHLLPTLRDQALFILGVKTGFRISELLSLTAADVKGDSVTVRRCHMKGRSSSRTVPLHPVAKRIVEEYVRMYNLYNGVLLFPITRQHAWRVIKHSAHLSGLSGNIATHSMRKSFGMNVYNRTGKNIVAAQRALGHKSLASTSCYLSVDQEIVDKAILED